MRTLLNEVLAIENHLHEKALPEERLVFQAKMILDTELQDKVTAQKQVYHLINQYGRKQLKAELEAVHHKLFTDPEHLSFAQRIRKLFGI
jgi:hypothetical protein